MHSFKRSRIFFNPQGGTGYRCLIFNREGKMKYIISIIACGMISACSGSDEDSGSDTATVEDSSDTAEE